MSSANLVENWRAFCLLHAEEEVQALKRALIYLNTFVLEIVDLNTHKHWFCLQSLLTFQLNA